MAEQNEGNDRLLDREGSSPFSSEEETPEKPDNDNLDIEIPGNEEMEESERASEEPQELYYDSGLPGEEDIEDDPLDI